MAQHKLVNYKFLREHQNYLAHNLGHIHVNTFGDLKIHKETSLRLFLETQQVWSSFPISWRKLSSRSIRWRTYLQNDHLINSVCVGYNKWATITNITLKDLKNRLLSRLTSPKSNTDLNRKFNTMLSEEINPFIINNQMTSNKSLKSVQYKILHNAYPTMRHLFFWRIKPNPNCAHCNVPETTEHAIWHCYIAQEAITTLRDLLSRSQYVLQTISKEDFLYGIPNAHALNVIFTLIKRALILQRENKILLTEVFIKQLIKNEFNVEKYIATKNGKIRNFNRKWGYLSRVLNN